MSDVLTVVRDPARLAALRRLVLLDTGPSESFDRIARIAARSLRAPIALITLVDADRQYFKAAVGLPAPLGSGVETPLQYSICQYAVALGAPLVICDAGVEHWLDDNPAVTQLGVRAYAGVPLITDGSAVGTMCVLDVVAREWSDDDLATLEELAAVTMREIEYHRLERRLLLGRGRRL
jgi:GAF domain-containing protein